MGHTLIFERIVSEAGVVDAVLLQSSPGSTGFGVVPIEGIDENWLVIVGR